MFSTNILIVLLLIIAFAACKPAAPQTPVIEDMAALDAASDDQVVL